ncbi:MAG: GNAT family N-acetyltransferase [Deltaproteobacteria bacterium]|nr:GNAT family N-acetyltransferase [Deltaproteobacteria bacterium]
MSKTIDFPSTDASVDLPPGVTELDAVVVRQLQPADLEAVARIDEAATGVARPEFYRRRLDRARDSSIFLSLAAEVDGLVVGFMMVTFFQGEFGRPEAWASLDAVGVHPEFAGKHVGKALLSQLEMNLRALRVETLRTEVEWTAFDLLGFLAKSGFAPAPRLALEKKL